MTDKCWLLRKRADAPHSATLYWGPDFCGYTGVKALAGRYTAEEAAARVSDTSEMIHEDEAPEFAPQCAPEVKAVHLERQRRTAGVTLTPAQAKQAQRFLIHYQKGIGAAVGELPDLAQLIQALQRET
jgi:hypothetical protein